ncbi:MAG TPA: DUF423 domain-containing protein [Pseudomonadales bacterium]
MKLFFFLGCSNAGLAVAAGAFAAHGLKSRLIAHHLEIFQTGAQYHFYHALALLLVGLAVQQFPEQALLKWAGYLFILGILLFSGSLYTLAISGFSSLGAITPIGGLAFIAAWAMMATVFLKI